MYVTFYAKQKLFSLLVSLKVHLMINKEAL